MIALTIVQILLALTMAGISWGCHQLVDYKQIDWPLPMYFVILFGCVSAGFVTACLMSLARAFPDKTYLVNLFFFNVFTIIHVLVVASFWGFYSFLPLVHYEKQGVNVRLVLWVMFLQVALICVWLLLCYGVALALLDIVKSRKKKDSLKEQLTQIYDNSNEVSLEKIERLLRDFRILLDEVQLLSAERKILREKFTRVSTGQETDPSCAICICDFEAGQEVTAVGCRHLFHADCLTNWLEIKLNCPLCKIPMREGILRGLIDLPN
jgi:hypothetical protein